MESETNNFLNWVEIKNFKSIKDLRLDCKRVNVFIGKPNVGKSNILEGLGLLGGSFSNTSNSKKIFGDFFRYKSFSNLFFDDDVTHNINISSDRILSLIGYEFINKKFYISIGDAYWLDLSSQVIKDYGNEMTTKLGAESYRKIAGTFTKYLSESTIEDINNWARRRYSKEGYEYVQEFRYRISQSGNDYAGIPKLNSANNPVKRYDFRFNQKYSDIGENYLLPPYGANLFNVIDHHKEIREEIANLFRKDNLEFVLSKKDRKFYVQKNSGGYVYSYPYSNIADTFQRYTFYLAAIESNKNSVIIFEEPEVHSFPPYTQDVAYRMIYSETNQFFVSTHSPYLLHTLELLQG